MRTDNPAPSVETWRQRALNGLLIAVSGVAALAAGLILREAFLDPRQWPAAVAYTVLYGLVVLLTLWRRLPFLLRAGGLVAIGYATATLAMARGGLMGDGRLYLLILPILTWFLLGFRAAVGAAILSGLEYGFFALAAAQGWLARWLVRTENSLLPTDWLTAGTVLLLGVVTIGVLMMEYHRFQRRLLEETLALQSRYQAFTEANLAGIYVFQDGLIRYINPALCRMLGYQADEVVGRMGVDQLVHPDDLEMAQEKIQRRLREEPVGSRYLLRALRKDGSTLYCEVLARQIEYEGRPAILGAVLDVTDQVEALLRLERQVARLTMLKEIARQISDLNPPDVVMAQAVHLLVETFGYHHAAIFVQDQKTGDCVMRARAGQFVDLFPPDHRLSPGEGMVGWVARNGQTLLANDVTREPRYINRYPDRIPTRSELTVPLRVGSRIIGVLDVQSPQVDAFSEDDVRTLETLADQLAVALRNAHLYDALRASEATARALLDGLTDAAILLDREGTVLAVNQAMLRLAGEEDEGRIVGRPVATLGDILPLKEMETVVATGCPLRQDRCVGERWYEYNLYPSANPAGQIVRLAVLIRDVTEQREAARQMAQAEQLTALGRLAASLAHEINNPLQVIQNALEMMRERPLSPQEQTMLDMALQQTGRLAEMSRRTLGLARPSDGQRWDVRPHELVTQSLLLVRHRLERSGIQLEMDVPDNLPLLHVAPNDILQVLVNLLLNGIEAMPGGGRLGISAGAGDGEVWLRVTNNGSPLPSAFLDHLFEPFFTTKPDGTGLGLVICRQIAERYGGRITAENQSDGQGVAFTLYLPVRGPSGTGPAPAGPKS